MKDNISIEKIADVLRDETQSVEERIHHLFSAKHIGGEEAVKAVLPLLSNSSALLAHEAAYVLGQIQHESAVPYLTETLRNTSLDCMVRHEAAEALAAIGLPESIQVVKEYLNDQTKCVRETCYLALRSLEDKASGEALKYASSVYKTVDPVSTIKKNLSDNQSTESLREILLDEKEDLYKRYYALFQLRDRKAENQAQLAIMESLTKDKSSELFRHEVAFVLGQLQLLKSLKPLFECLSNTQEHPMARHEAAIAIGSVVIGNMSSTSCCQKAIEKLEEFSSDSTQVVAESCLVALDNINREKNLIEAY